MASLDENGCSQAPTFKKIFRKSHLRTGRVKLPGRETDHYLIWRAAGPGFFSIVSGVLGHLKIAEESNLVPIVDLSVAESTYAESHPLFGTRNMWEYYFAPIGPIGWKTSLAASRIRDCGGEYPFEKLGFPYAATPWLPQTWDKFVQLRPETLHAVQAAIKQIEPNRRVLGVHFRGKEMRTALHHPMPPTEAQIFRRVDRLLKEAGYERIFLVSEGSDYVASFRKRYGSLVYTLPVARSGSSNVYKTYGRPMHKYKLGLEILTEVHVLSKCGGLVSGFSNVSQFAEVLSRGNYAHVESVWNGKLRGGRLAAPFLWNYRSWAPTTMGGFRK